MMNKETSIKDRPVIAHADSPAIPLVLGNGTAQGNGGCAKVPPIALPEINPTTILLPPDEGKNLPLRVNPVANAQLDRERPPLKPDERTLRRMAAAGSSNCDQVKRWLEGLFDADLWRCRIRAICAGGIAEADLFARFATEMIAQLTPVRDSTEPRKRRFCEECPQLSRASIMGVSVALLFLAVTTTSAVFVSYWLVSQSQLPGLEKKQTALAACWIWSVTPMGLMKLCLTVCGTDRQRKRVIWWSAVAAGVVFAVGLPLFAATFGEMTFGAIDYATYTSGTSALRVSCLVTAAMLLEGLLSGIVFELYVTRPLVAASEDIENPAWQLLVTKLQGAARLETAANSIRARLHGVLQSIEAEKMVFVETGAASVAALRKQFETELGLAKALKESKWLQTHKTKN